MTEHSVDPVGSDECVASTERTWLDETSWVDVSRGWLDDADRAYATLADAMAWQTSTVFRYDRSIEEPRLGAYWRPGNPVPHEAIVDTHRALQRRYKVRFDGCGMAYYRNERDSVAFHRDRDMQWLDDTVIAILTLGAQRPFLIRPRANRYAHDLPDRGATLDLAPAAGDLIVMGGACQAGWEHSVPKLTRRSDGRISLQWRWTSRRGRQERGGSYSKPRHYSD